MNKIERTLFQHLFAALLILSAAFCAAAQSRANAREEQPVAPAKQNSRQASTTTPPAPAKQNERASDARESKVESSSSPAAAPAPDAPHYFYEFKQPDFYVSHIQIEHDESGQGRVSFERRGEDEPITEPFELSETARARIKALWESLRFLDSDAKYQSDRQYPHLGSVILRLKRGERERSAEFNWTDNKDAHALADEYRRIADQAVWRFDVSVALVNDPLKAPKLMDQLENMLKRNGLSDPLQLLPMLRDLSTDERIPLIARNHAERLVKQIKK